MKEFVTSLSSLTLSMSVFGLQVLADVVRSDGTDRRQAPAVKALDAVSGSAVAQFDPSLRAAFRVLDTVQRGVTSIAFCALRRAGQTPLASARSTSRTPA